MRPRKGCYILNKKDHFRQYTEIISSDVSDLTEDLERAIEDPQMIDQMKNSLQQLVDLKFALDESSIVAVTDAKGKITYINDKFCEISKYDKDELLGHDHRIINSKYHSKEFFSHLWKTISSGEVWKGEIKNKAKDSSFYWVNTTIVPFLNREGEPYQYLSIRTEVTELKRVEEELQLMMTKMMRIQEGERKKISRDLHDGVGQSLFSLLIQIDRLRESFDKSSLTTLRDDVVNVIQEVRNISSELRPSVLDDLGVVPAIRSYLQTYAQHYGIEVHFDCTLRKRLDLQIETTIYRIIQEALTNISKYADVSEAYISMQEKEKYLYVDIYDQGVGFSTNIRGNGVGLFSMEERARAVGGSLDIESFQGKGTKISLIVPL